MKVNYAVFVPLTKNPYHFMSTVLNSVDKFISIR